MKNRNFFWGIVFILAAVFILLGNFGFFHDINSPKVFLSLLLLYFIVKSIPYRNFYGILIPAALICILYDDLLHITAVTPFPLLAASVFASIGLSFLFPSRPHFKTGVSFDSSYDHVDESRINCCASFTGTTKYINTTDFCQAYLKCSFGSLKVYFDHAHIAGSSAEIYIANSFGETILFLPKDWNTNVTVTTTFGDIEEIHKPPVAMPDAPTVTISGSISFGDCKIYYI